MASNGLDIFSPKGGLSKSNPNVNVGAGADVDKLSWGGKAEQFEDLPTTFRRGASTSNALVLRKESAERQAKVSTALARPEDIKAPFEMPKNLVNNTIASGIRKLDKAVKNGDRMVQRKIAWQATPTGIVIVTLEREMKWLDRNAKKIAPAGEWLIENRRRFASLGGPATKRVGDVKHTTTTGAFHTEGEVTYVDGAEKIEDAFVAGVEAMSYLPIAVRGDIVSQVRNPTYFDGRILGQPDREGNVKEYQVDLLRMDDEVGLVIKATRKLEEDHWHVMQAKYFLSTPEIESA